MPVKVERTYSGRVIWTRAVDDFLRSCINRRMTHASIARLLGISRNSVIGRVYRMKKDGVL